MLEQVDVMIVEQEFEADARMCRKELRHPIHLERIEEVRLRGDSEGSARQLLVFYEVPYRLKDFREAHGALRMESSASVREHELAGRSLHELDAESGFELLDPAAYAVGWFPEPACGAREAASLDDVREKLDIVEVDHIALTSG